MTNKQSVEELGNETYVDDFNEFDSKAFARDVSPNGHVFTEPELQAYKQSIREEYGDLIKISEEILELLKHPTKPVTMLEQDKLEQALQQLKQE